MGNKTLFSIKDVSQLRQRAQKADGPMTLLAAFTSLHIKKGFTLRFEHSGCCEGLGNVWAVPVSSPSPAPEEYEMVHWSKVPCPFLISEGCGDINAEEETFKLPRPPDALDNIMEAIGGDGTPQSYLSASIFAREIAEFGAMWPGKVWSTHTILGEPSEWSPSVIRNDKVITVRFYTFSELVDQAFYRYTDTYKVNNYKSEYHVKKIVVGRGEGYIF